MSLQEEKGRSNVGVADDVIGRIVEDCEQRVSKEIKEEIADLKRKNKELGKELNRRDREIDKLEQECDEKDDRISWMDHMVNGELPEMVSTMEGEIESFVHQVKEYRKEFNSKKTKKKGARK